MTALTQFDRLEAPGIWRPAPEEQRRDVIVSLGDATLTLSDQADQALTHWSLPALHRMNPGKTPALYAPSDMPDATEELEIADDDMVEAIETVRKAIARARPRPGRLRLAGGLALAAALITVSVVWVPDTLRQQTAALLPDVTRAEVGAGLVDQLRPVTGAPCQAPAARAPLATLASRAGGDPAPQVLVVHGGITRARHLPGGFILLHRDLIEAEDEPDVAAGFILAERLRATQTDPMVALLDHAGLGATIRLLTTGTLPQAVLADYAAHLLATPPAPLPDALIVAGFAAAQLRLTPYAFALDPTGEATLPLIEADPVPMSRATPLLPDDAWVRLQGICLE